MQFSYIGNQSKKDVRLASSFANGAFARANAAFIVANTGGGSATPILIYSDYFTANGVTTTFNLSTSPVSENYITVVVDGISQLRNTYGVSGNVVTFDSAFENGANVEITTITGGGALDPYALSVANLAYAHANAAYAQANTGGGSSTDAYARNTANAGFITANSASSFANGAFDRANAAFLQANNSTDTWVRTQANNAYDQANSGASFANGSFVTANSAASFANGAFDRANAAYNAANNATDIWVRNNSNAAYSTANSAASFANGAFVTANSSASFANGAFTTANNALPKEGGGTVSGNVIINGVLLITGNDSSGITFSDGSVQYTANASGAAFGTANSAASFANGAFTAANTANSRATSSGLFANGSFERANAAYAAANSAGSFANGAFTTANLKFNSTGGTISGDVTITGNLAITGNTFAVSATQIVANDTMFIMGVNNYTTDVLDIGLVAHYNDGTNAHAGFIRDAGTKEWHVFDGYTPEVGANNNINISHASFKTATLNANLKSTTITIKEYRFTTICKQCI